MNTSTMSSYLSLISERLRFMSEVVAKEDRRRRTPPSTGETQRRRVLATHTTRFSLRVSRLVWAFDTTTEATMTLTDTTIAARTLAQESLGKSSLFGSLDPPLRGDQQRLLLLLFASSRDRFSSDNQLTVKTSSRPTFVVQRQGLVCLVGI